MLKRCTIILFLFQCFVARSQEKSNIDNRDLSYLTSGGKLLPLQAIIDIRHYTIALDIDIKQQSINGSVEVSLNLFKTLKKTTNLALK